MDNREVAGPWVSRPPDAGSVRGHSKPGSRAMIPHEGTREVTGNSITG